MKQLYYAVQNVIRGADSVLIKIVSLTFGLLIAILLFTKVAFELNYDNFYENPDCLYQVRTAWVDEKEGKRDWSPYNIYPTAGMIAQHFPEEVECATTVNTFFNARFTLGDKFYKPENVMADSLYIQTMGIKLLQGNAHDLGTPYVVFLSESFARELFGSTDAAIGKSLSLNGINQSVLIRGIFADIPENTALKRPQLLLSSASRPQYAAAGWRSGGNFEAYVRFRHPEEADKIVKRVNALLPNYFPTEHYSKMNMTSIEIDFIPIQEVYLDNKEVQRRLWILSLLGLALLFTATLNYALVSISSLSYRAKAVGIHKCSGAGMGSIMAIFLWETLLVVGVSLALVVILILYFREKVEELTEVSLGSLFAFHNLYAPLLAVVFLLVVGGLLPGKLFSSIPVTQVFRQYTENKKRWKYPLLFFQFSGAAFLFGLLCVVMAQYHYSTNKDLGYNDERVAFTYNTFSNSENAVSILRNLPFVESVSSSNAIMTEAYQPMPVKDENGKTLFYPRMNWGTPDFFSFIGLRLKEGRFPTNKNEFIVNEAYVRKMGWSGSGIGEVVQEHGTVTGIMENYRFADIKEMEAMEFRVWDAPVADCMHVRLKEPLEENLQRLNDEMKRIYPRDNISFISYDENKQNIFRKERLFRDVTMLATVAIIAITLLGLIGYTNDEVRRRSKEIAIRKINGAEVSTILQLLVRDVLYLSLPAVLIGIVASIYAGHLWQAQFKDQLNISPLFYIVCGMLVLLFVVGTVIVKAWRIANENPVNSIKTE